MSFVIIRLNPTIIQFSNGDVCWVGSRSALKELQNKFKWSIYRPKT